MTAHVFIDKTGASDEEWRKRAAAFDETPNVEELAVHRLQVLRLQLITTAAAAIAAADVMELLIQDRQDLAADLEPLCRDEHHPDPATTVYCAANAGHPVDPARKTQGHHSLDGWDRW